MTGKLIIFGAAEIAELAHFYFENDTQHDVAAFVVDDEFVRADTFCGLPVVPRSAVEKQFPPSEFDAFVALSYAKLNAVRREKFLSMKAAGYTLVSYVSSRASVLGGNSIGENCFILEDNTIQPFARLGNNVTLWSGNHIGHHSRVLDHTFIASHVVISGGVTVGESCFLGVNATIRDHVSLGDRCVIGAGALILADAEADGVYLGQAAVRSRVPSGRLRSI